MGNEKVSREISSAAGGVAVTLSDDTVYDPPGRALYVGTTGDLVVRMAGNQASLTFSNIPSGTLLPIAVDQVLSTGSTASDVLLLF